MVAETRLIPNDPLYNEQWFLRKISAPRAWDISTGTATTRVCVVDSGVDYNHPDLAPNMPAGVLRTGWNAITDTANALDVVDGHGTHLSGVIGAAGDNGIGVSGVTWKGKVLNCKFINKQGQGYIGDALKCLDWCKNNGATIINLSFSGRQQSKALKDKMTLFGSVFDTVFVVAAGNGDDNDNPVNNDNVNAAYRSWPAAYNLPWQINVVASDQYDEIVPWSSHGNANNARYIAAPGVDIKSTLPLNSYATWSGTSMAAPTVTGALSLMYSAVNGSLTNAQLHSLLLSTCEILFLTLGLWCIRGVD